MVPCQPTSTFLWQPGFWDSLENHDAIPSPLADHWLDNVRLFSRPQVWWEAMGGQRQLHDIAFQLVSSKDKTQQTWPALTDVWKTPWAAIFKSSLLFLSILHRKWILCGTSCSESTMLCSPLNPPWCHGPMDLDAAALLDAAGCCWKLGESSVENCGDYCRRITVGFLYAFIRYTCHDIQMITYTQNLHMSVWFGFMCIGSEHNSNIKEPPSYGLRIQGGI